MSGPTKPAGNTPSEQPSNQPSDGSNPAQAAFGKYKSRLAAMPAWAMPPSMGALPGFPFGNHGQQQPHAMGSLTERLGMTLRLGIDLLNAGLASGVSALGSGGSMPDWGGHGGGCGCEGNRHGYDCCEVMGNGCRPGAHGCGCGCC